MKQITILIAALISGNFNRWFAAEAEFASAMSCFLPFRFGAETNLGR